MNNFYLLALKRSLLNLGFGKFLFLIFIKTVILLRVKFTSVSIKIFPTFSKKYLEKNYFINSLFDYRSLSNFQLNDKNKYLKNHYKIFSNKFEDYSFFNKREYVKTLNWSNRSISQGIFNNFNNYKENSSFFTNWQLDANSKYVWQPSVKSDSIKIGSGKDIDVKVPWEISRLQHLNKISLYSFKNNQEYNYNYIKNQIFDFIGSNPPMYGVNWINAMEVAIRGSNLCMIADILITDNKVSTKEKKIILNSINDHFIFVINNLEWSPFSRNNHYLSNIVGLLVMGYFLPRDDFTSSILNFARDQFFNEIHFQFYEDGGNKEGSTAYHLFLSEIIIIGLYFCEKLKKENIKNKSLFKISFLLNKVFLINFVSKKVDKKFKKNMENKIEKILTFSKQIIKSNNSFVQIGDNDSGCFFDLDCSYENMEKKKLHFLLSNNKKKNLFYLISKEIEFFFPKEKKELKIKKRKEFSLRKKYKFINSYFFRFPKKIRTSDIKINYFKDFGMYCYSNKTLRMFIICKKKFDYLNSGHFHYDNLSIDLTFKNKNVITDPGSFLYTSNRKKRLEYKYLTMHFCPFFKKIKPLNEKYLFSNETFFPADVLFFDNKNFYGQIRYKEGKIIRQINILNNGLLVNDYSNDNQIENLLECLKGKKISTSYGILSKDEIINPLFL